MDCSKVTPAQAETLRRRVARELDWFNRLCGRFEAWFPEGMPLADAAVKTRDAVRDLDGLLAPMTKQASRSERQTITSLA